MMSKSTTARRSQPRPSARHQGLLPPLQRLLRNFSPYWLACIPLAAIIVMVWGGAASAQHAFDLEEYDFTDPEVVKGVLDTVFIFFCAVLVIFMNAGFGMLETGFCRQKNAVNILSKNLIVFAIAVIAYWAFGFAFMYGADAGGFIGTSGFFLASEDPGAYGLDPFPGGLPISISFLFQVAFAATAATIVSGAVAERIKFIDFLIFSFLLVGISYAITGHWFWGGGWLGSLPFGGEEGASFHDFAGSTIVHSVGGWAALMGAAFLGPRTGKYNEDGSINAIPGHNMSIATLGCLILWIGWYGFNPGSELAATPNVTYIAVTTTLAASAGGVAATITAWIKDGKPDLSMIINGILAGLVGITAGCDAIPYPFAVLTGAIAGVIVVFAVSLFDSIKIDDPVGAISVHLVCGIWGTLAVGFFGGANILAQIVGILSIGGFTVVFSSIVWLILKATLGIRVSVEEEVEGLDIGEHGMEAYSGFVKEADTLVNTAVIGTVGDVAGSEV
ncbi:MAG: ammonium transporter [Spirulinaceae cyanobacterium RM2_2_10]|nr:ammonium transporter [Spirulinaceae cyanobacterium SM2_1_0]NJO20276.1 ammonium transporter [Spirulinaceae cyanobacterium RM2_2_10]